jgi:hypothetical protein
MDDGKEYRNLDRDEEVSEELSVMGDDTRDFIASEDESERGDEYSIASSESRNMGQEDNLNLGAPGGTVPNIKTLTL